MSCGRCLIHAFYKHTSSTRELILLRLRVASSCVFRPLQFVTFVSLRFSLSWRVSPPYPSCCCLNRWSRQMLRETRVCVMRLSYLSQDRADLGEPVKRPARSMTKADTRKPQRSQEGCTLLDGNQTDGPSLVSSNFPKQAFRPTLTVTSQDVVQPVGAQRAWFKWLANML